MPSPLFYLGVAVVKDQLYAIGGMTAILTPGIAENKQYTPFGYGTIPPDQRGFLGSGLPMEYGYAIAVVIIVTITAATGYLHYKRRK